MTPIHTKVTSQGQISVPLPIRKKLGIGPGSVLEWRQQGNEVVVRRAGRYSFADIHRAVFPDGPPKRHTLAESKEGIAGYIRKKHAR